LSFRYAWFEQHTRSAGLPRIRLHDVRHSYATAALAAGSPPGRQRAAGARQHRHHQGHLQPRPARLGRARGRTVARLSLVLGHNDEPPSRPIDKPLTTGCQAPERRKEVKRNRAGQRGASGGSRTPTSLRTPGPKLPTRCAGWSSPGLDEAFELGGRQSVVPSCTRSSRSVAARPVSNLVSIGGSGPVRSRTPAALRSSATRDRSAGRARQGRWASSGTAAWLLVGLVVHLCVVGVALDRLDALERARLALIASLVAITWPLVATRLKRNLPVEPFLSTTKPPSRPNPLRMSGAGWKGPPSERPSVPGSSRTIRHQSGHNINLPGPWPYPCGRCMAETAGRQTVGQH
jgi:hypothetical protein